MSFPPFGFVHDVAGGVWGGGGGGGNPHGQRSNPLDLQHAPLLHAQQIKREINKKCRPTSRPCLARLHSIRVSCFLSFFCPLDLRLTPRPDPLLAAGPPLAPLRLVVSEFQNIQPPPTAAELISFSFLPKLSFSGTSAPCLSHVSAVTPPPESPPPPPSSPLPFFL